MRLTHRTVVVTGATGIAAAGARRAAREGAAVFVISLEEIDCRNLVEDIESEGGTAAGCAADLSDEPAASGAFGEAMDFLGGIDGLFAVAGGSGRRFGDGPAHEMSLDAWQRTFEINTHPMFLATRHALEAMKERGGSIVVIGSVLATSPVPSLFATHAYAAAKGAANAYVTTLAAHYAGEGIRVNGIAPGLVTTPMSARAAADADTVEYARRKQPLAAGFLEPEDIAAAAVFLLSDDAAQITGQVIAVDGGWSVTEA